MKKAMNALTTKLAGRVKPFLNIPTALMTALAVGGFGLSLWMVDDAIENVPTTYAELTIAHDGEEIDGAPPIGTPYLETSAYASSMRADASVDGNLHGKKVANCRPTENVKYTDANGEPAMKIVGDMWSGTGKAKAWITFHDRGTPYTISHYVNGNLINQETGFLNPPWSRTISDNDLGEVYIRINEEEVSWKETKTQKEWVEESQITEVNGNLSISTSVGHDLLGAEVEFNTGFGAREERGGKWGYWVTFSWEITVTGERNVLVAEGVEAKVELGIIYGLLLKNDPDRYYTSSGSISEVTDHGSFAEYPGKSASSASYP